MIHVAPKLKTLEVVELTSCDYKLSPGELSLFKQLPVKFIDPSILDLSRETLDGFLEIFEEMGSFSYLNSCFHKFSTS